MSKSRQLHTLSVEFYSEILSCELDGNNGLNAIFYEYYKSVP